MSGWGTWLAGAGVLVALAGLAVVDATRFRISWGFLAALILSAGAWRISSQAPAAEALLQGLTGAVVGGLVGAVPVAWWKFAGGRTLLGEGDVLLLAAIGFLVGPAAISWALLLGGSTALLHRSCVQRKRGRRLAGGVLPLAPGMALGAAGAFAAMNAGILQAGLEWR